MQVKEQMIIQLVQQRDELQDLQNNAELDLEELGKASNDEMAEWQR